ncbi:MAG: alpha/beta fold hydrolase, partial [Bacteroidia bacterium]|nr:alpha/beta fold hydrolase [Bacteroidia bacterium]
MKLFYRQYGENKPLVILHGLFGQSDNWATLAKKMADSGIQAITVDLRNHGQSPHTNEMDYEMMAQDVFELMQELHLESPIILGHSMGGKVAMMLDRLYPGFLRQIIIADISPRQYPAGHTQVFEALNAVNFDVVKTRKDVELILRKFLNDEAVIQFLLKNVYWETPEKLNWRFNLKSIQNHYDKILASIPDYQSNT